MKRLMFICMLGLFLGASSCSLIEEDFSDCPDCPPSDHNVELTFSYLGDTDDPEMFKLMIDKVNLMAYDSYGERVVDKEIAKSALDLSQGTTLSLDAGSYRIVCWANAKETTEFASCETYLTGRIHNPAYPRGQNITTNCHLYYGYYDIIVPEEGITRGDIPFAGAHINMEVYVRGAKSIPEVKVHNLMPQYDLAMQPVMPYTTTYYPDSEFNTERLLYQSLFQVFLFEDEDPVIVEITGGAGDPPSTIIQLAEFMRENDISVSGKNEGLVRILIEFNEDLGVTIKVPDWEPGEVVPET